MKGAKSLPRLAVMGLVLFTCLSLAIPGLHAQSSTASVNGTVRGSSGAVVPAAEVVLENTQTNVERRAIL